MTGTPTETAPVRIALGVEYDGARFHGFETQRDTRTVQGVLEHALSRVADQPIRVVCAGRTDSGVHALAQVVHFDTTAARSARSWVLGCNSHLDKDVSALWACEVDEGFHARFSAVSRSYRYMILNRTSRPALLNARASWICQPLDAVRMQEAAQQLVGEHDFSAYRAAGCQARSSVRIVRRLEVWRDGEFVHIDVTANAFLQHMVRNLAGVLIAIGDGRRAVGWAGEVLASRDRRTGGVTAPPHGLYLSEVEYPPHFQIPRLSSQFAVW